MKKIIVLCSVLTVLLPLHWFAMKWISDRHVFCRDKAQEIKYNEFVCDYPQQRISIEPGVVEKIGVCRCP